jgi:hypothetical protein
MRGGGGGGGSSPGEGVLRRRASRATGPRDRADRLDLLCVRRGGAARRAPGGRSAPSGCKDGGLGRVAPGTLPHSRRGRRRRRPSRARPADDDDPSR